MNRGVHIPIQSIAKDHLTEAIKKNNAKNLSLTIKNYVGRRGLSEHIFNNIRYQEQVEVKGPLGTGLQIQNNGTHVAFAAGTGILPFLDLIGHLILRILDMNMKG